MKHPAYQLRTNKALDRLTLISQIGLMIDDPKKATFYSLSGPFLEDMKLAHQAFPQMKLVSIESNEHTFKRQKFHQFTSRLTLKRSALGEFITHLYEPGHQDFFWLDYTDLQLRRFQEFRDVVTRAPHGSIVRITVRAEPDWTLSHTKQLLTDEEQARLKEKIEADFIREFGGVLSHDAPKTPLCTSPEFARVIQLMIRRIASEALDNGSERDFLHMSSARYDDGSQMLSVTGAVLNRDQIVPFRQKLKEKDLLLEQGEWSEPIEIQVPNLTMLERHVLDKNLPKRSQAKIGEQLHAKLKYNIDNGERRSIDALKQYARYYLEYPSFIKANL